jgi:hypothetical protein
MQMNLWLNMVEKCGRVIILISKDDECPLVGREESLTLRQVRGSGIPLSVTGGNDTIIELSAELTEEECGRWATGWYNQ